MTLVLDHNLSFQLKRLLADLFDGIFTLTELGMDEAEDIDVWRYARERGWAMMSKDGDWADLALLHGAPPKVIRLQIGNGPWRSAAEVVLANAPTLRASSPIPRRASFSSTESRNRVGRQRTGTSPFAARRVAPRKPKGQADPFTPQTDQFGPATFGSNVKVGLS